MSLADARTEYNTCVEKLKNGVDPAFRATLVPQEVPSQEEEKTVDWMTKKYLEWSLANHSPAWYKNSVLTINKHLPKEWRSRPIGSIKKRDAISLMEQSCIELSAAQSGNATWQNSGYCHARCCDQRPGASEARIYEGVIAASQKVAIICGRGRICGVFRLSNPRWL